ncbi:30S ribosomal protein S3 [Candidatus Peregrinibacteria bacterium]|nr:30S ribosomal protein S3 [Candidatus Peregrinibacteria bacterium]
MGQKVDPNGLRIGITHTWNSRWYADKKKYPKLINLDFKVRKHLMEKLKSAGIARIDIERTNKSTHVSLYTAKPGVIIGRQGTAVEDLKKELLLKFNERFDISIKEVKRPDLESTLVADNVARQLERRIAFRRAAKAAIQKTMEAGAKGIKIHVSGRLGGVEIARNEFFTQGKIPLHTFRADISYAEDKALTTYGAIGVKVWIYRGEIFKKKGKNEEDSAEKADGEEVSS